MFFVEVVVHDVLSVCLLCTLTHLMIGLFKDWLSKQTQTALVAPDQAVGTKVTPASPWLLIVLCHISDSALRLVMSGSTTNADKS